MDTKIRMAKGRHKTSVSSIACGLHGVVCFSKVLKPSPEAYQVLPSKVNKSTNHYLLVHGERESIDVVVACGRLLSIREARVLLDFRLVRLPRFSRA